MVGREQQKYQVLTAQTDREVIEDFPRKETRQKAEKRLAGVVAAKKYLAPVSWAVDAHHPAWCVTCEGSSPVLRASRWKTSGRVFCVPAVPSSSCHSRLATASGFAVITSGEAFLTLRPSGLQRHQQQPNGFCSSPRGRRWVLLELHQASRRLAGGRRWLAGMRDLETDIRANPASLPKRW